MTKYEDPLQQAAHKLGWSKGEDFANLLVDRGTDAEDARIILNGFENDDEEVLALCPEPLKGEWAGEPTPFAVMSDIASLAEAEGLLEKPNIEEALDAAEDLLEVFEHAYRDGFWETAIKRSKEIMEATPIEQHND